MDIETKPEIIVIHDSDSESDSDDSLTSSQEYSYIDLVTTDDDTDDDTDDIAWYCIGPTDGEGDEGGESKPSLAEHDHGPSKSVADP